MLLYYSWQQVAGVFGVWAQKRGLQEGHLVSMLLPPLCPSVSLPGGSARPSTYCPRLISIMSLSLQEAVAGSPRKQEDPRGAQVPGRTGIAIVLRMRWGGGYGGGVGEGWGGLKAASLRNDKWQTLGFSDRGHNKQSLSGEGLDHWDQGREIPFWKYWLRSKRGGWEVTYLVLPPLWNRTHTHASGIDPWGGEAAI